jgi:hypothetical protein
MSDQPSCQTCSHWRPGNEAYPGCEKVNRRPGWGPLELMPAEADEWCFRHDDTPTTVQAAPAARERT